MTDRAKIAILDTSFSAIPLVEAIDLDKSEIFVVGSKRDDYLTKFQNIKYVESDYRDVDLLRKIKKRLGIDFIIPGCNDVSYTSYATLNDENNKHLSVFESLNNKIKFREICRNSRLLVPETYKDLNSAIGKNVLIKPCVSFSGQGISHCDEHSSAKNLCKSIKKAKMVCQDSNFVIEEFIVGQLFSASIFLRNSQIKTFYVVKEYCLDNPFSVNWSFIDEGFEREIKNSFFDRLKDVPSSLGVNNGLLHLQCIKSNSGDIYLIECTLRCPGDLYPYLIELQTGDNYSARYLEAFIPKDLIKRKETLKSRNVVVRHTSSNYANSIFKGFQHNGKKALFSFPTLKFGDVNSKINKYRSGVHFYLENNAPSISNMIQHQTKSDLCYSF